MMTISPLEQITPSETKTVTSQNSDLESLQDTIAKSVNSHVTDQISHPPTEIRYAVDEQIQWIVDKPENKVATKSTVNLTEMTSITEDQSLKDTLAKQAEQITLQAE